MKKLRILCVLLSILLLAGCSNAPAQVTEPETTIPDLSSPEEQIKLLMQQINTWKVPDELESETYYYAVTDLDQNGRLEILEASTQGTGIYTYGALYEVSADFTDVHECMTPCKQDGDLPEIIMDSAPAAYDPDSGCYDYLFTNETRNGAAEHYESIVAMRLQNGNLTCTTLATSVDLWIDEGIESHEYAVANGDDFMQVSAEQYAAVMDDYQANRQGFTANFQWFTFKEEVTETVLGSSWNTFSASFQ